MNTACQCSREKTLRAAKNSVGWIVPGTLLALLPKCPLCLAAWLSVALGLGISTTVATLLQVTLTSVCSASILIFLSRHLIQQFR